MSDFRSVDQLSGQVVVNPLAEMEEHLADEIPCGGIQAEVSCRRDCGKAAVLRGCGHGCRPQERPAYFKCIGCWQAWYMAIARKIAQTGAVACTNCGRRFTTVEAFNDYREF